MSKFLLSIALAGVMFVATDATDAAPKGGSRGHAGSAKSHSGGASGASKGNGSSSNKSNGAAKTGTGTSKGTAKGSGTSATNKGSGSGANGTNKGTGSASAKGGGTGNNKGAGAASNKGNGKGLGSGKGTRFEHGICYHGRDHHHWGTVRFDPRYGCQCYWDPYVSAWYYWCQPDDCYYPVSYCPYRCYTCTTRVVLPAQTAEPALAQALPIINNNNFVQVNTPPSIPANPGNELPAIPEPAEPRR